MTPTDLRVAVRRLWPRRVRTRLAVFYAVLFLLVGVVLLALTYAVAATVVVPGPGELPEAHFRRKRRCWDCVNPCLRLRRCSRNATT
jgi:hypothetical protein